MNEILLQKMSCNFYDQPKKTKINLLYLHERSSVGKRIKPAGVIKIAVAKMATLYTEMLLPLFAPTISH
jgi:hypothetical protein